MGQLQSLLKSNSKGFEKMTEDETPGVPRRVLSDPRSPTMEVCRTPIESNEPPLDAASTPKSSKNFVSLRRWLAQKDHDKELVITPIRDE